MYTHLKYHQNRMNTDLKQLVFALEMTKRIEGCAMIRDRGVKYGAGEVVERA